MRENYNSYSCEQAEFEIMEKENDEKGNDLLIEINFEKFVIARICNSLEFHICFFSTEAYLNNFIVTPIVSFTQ